MSVQKVFSVYDSKAQAYLQPFHAINAAVASRMIADAVSQPDHNFNRHAADFTLFELGDFDDLTGTFANHSTAINLGNLITFLSPEQNLKVISNA